ncbi:MAG TPA: ABC transporter permease [Puia sp.]|nr:ABC transporter permease [Puia sp.]
MLLNFFKIAYRNFLRGKWFSVINISGLAIGMASALLILLAVQNEWTYDRFYKNSDRLYQSWNRDRGNKGITCWNVTPKPLGPALKKDYPEIEQATRVGWDQTILFTLGDKKINIKGTMVDPDFLTMFEFPFISGNMHTALDRPDDIVITAQLAKKLFGDEDPMGKTVRLDNKYNFRVSGLMKDLPNNTQFDFEFLLPWSYMHTIGQDDSTWANNSTRNYVLLKPNADIKKVNARIRDIIIQHGQKDWTTQSFLYPVSRLRLYGNFENGQPAGGNIESVRVFAMIAALILFIACINFMNMSTARSEKRAREVGIRKVVGAGKGSLIGQFLGESILIAGISGGLALLLLQISLPAFNLVIGKQLFIDFSSIYFWFFFIGFILFTGVLSGSYPAFFLSSFRPVSVLKGSFKKVQALVTPRKVLVVLQFSFAVILIVATIVIERQVKYAQERQSGYNRDNIIWTYLSGDISKNYELIKNALINEGVALSVSKSSAPLTESWNSGGADWNGKNPNDRSEFNFFNSDGNLVKTAGLQLVMGRDIDLKSYPTDSTAVILNEAAVKVMGFKNPIGQIIDHGAWDADWHVIGVVRDFILQSPYDQVKPIVIQGPRADWFNLMHIKLNGARSTAQNLAAAEKIFKQYNPQYPFEYRFTDEDYAKKFNDERTTGTLTAFFAGLSIFISCLGLFGLAAYMAENRTREIGVRKVLGASVTGIATLLSKDFVMLVVISILVASPIAWWAMQTWLAGYNYHIGLSWWIFVLAGFLAILIALITVSFQAIRAALANPIKSLRTE